MPDVPVVKIGDEEYRIVPFRGFKGELALALVKRASREAKELFAMVDTHDREWRAKNDLTITRELCLERINESERLAKSARGHIPDAPEKTPEDTPEGEDVKKTKAELEAEAAYFDSRVPIWNDQLEQLGDRAFVKVPNPNGPPLQETVLEVFPKAMEIAPKTVKQLLALVVISNEDLRKADEDDDNAIGALDQLGKELFYEGLIEELLELAVVAIDVIAKAVEKYRGPLGKIKAEVEEMLGRRESKKEKKPTTTGETTSTSESPTGSTSSPSATDGPEETSSSESAGESSLASASA